MKSNLKAFGYYGGKFSKLDWLLPQLETPHKTYVELCGGSAAVLLNKPRAQVEVLNDLAGEVADFWKAMREHPDELITAIKNSPAGEAEFKRILVDPQSDDLVETARRFYVHVVQAFSGVPKCTSHSFARGALRYSNAIKNLNAVAERMRGVVVENTTATRLVSRVVDDRWGYERLQPILFYADPPYTADSRKSKDNYLHDDFDHEKFLGVVLDTPDFCKFAISGYDNELYNSMLSDWHRVELETRLIVRNNGKMRTEVLWRNYEPSTLQSRLDI